MFLLDTNVISEVRKRQNCNLGVADWYTSVQAEGIYTSVLVIGEIRKGIEQLRRRNDLQQVAILEIWLEAVKHRFGDRILGIDTEISEAWGRMYYKRGFDKRNAIDLLLAATAEVHGLTLVTRNVRDVQGLGVNVLNPFS